jgi:hypothetical protein
MTKVPKWCDFPYISRGWYSGCPLSSPRQPAARDDNRPVVCSDTRADQSTKPIVSERAIQYIIVGSSLEIPEQADDILATAPPSSTQPISGVIGPLQCRAYSQDSQTIIFQFPLAIQNPVVGFHNRPRNYYTCFNSQCRRALISPNSTM